MTISIAPSDTTIFTAIKAFVNAVLGSGVRVVQGQVNRVPEPASKNFAVMWPISRPRLATNIDSFVDTAFTASIAATVLTVTAMIQGSIRTGASLFGTGVAAGSIIGTQISGTPGGIGTYALLPTQTVTSRTMASGEMEAMQETEIVVQLDIHSNDLATAGSNAAIVATMWRDDYACQQIATIDPDLSPLYCADPRQIPFIDGEQQYESRYTLDLHLQANQKVTGIPQQFAAALAVEVINVDAVFPVS